MAFQNGQVPTFKMINDETGEVRTADKRCEADMIAIGFRRLTVSDSSKTEDGSASDAKALAKLKKDDLVALCEQNDLDTAGNKAELIDRLAAAGVVPAVTED